MRPLLVKILLLTLVAPCLTETLRGSPIPTILSMRERAQLQDRWLGIRLDRVLPTLMRREGIDLWIIASREYNEDPVFWSMKPSTWLAARRRTILVLHDPGLGQALERLAVARYGVGEFFQQAWDPETQADQLARLAEIVVSRNPSKIALNYSADFALADGMSWSEMGAIRRALPPRFRDRVVSGERLAIGWLETRIQEELDVYPTICRIAHAIIAEGFSSRAIQPGFTTTEDVEWWFRERIRSLKLTTWFHPSVSIQRFESGHSGSFADRQVSRVIQRGDLIHVDFGITYLGLNTDTQQHAYVLKRGETAPPEGLASALTKGNRLQDILTSNFREGRSGNEILRRSLERAAQEGLKPSIYTHPLGFHGHAAGPTIGLWDQQGGVPVQGDYPVYDNTVYSIELNVTVPIPEWDGQEIRIMLEEDAVYQSTGVRYLDGRQTTLIVIE